ncbi:hypothetical protein BH23GEM6_BH23GEM6_13060 [soil metagenome]
MSIWLAAALLLHLAAGSAETQGFPPAPERGPEVRSVQVVGAGEIDPNVISRVTATRKTRCRSPLLLPACALRVEAALEREYLDEAMLREDEERLQALHISYGYPAARVNAEVNRLPRGGVEVRFIARPGEPLMIRSVEIRGLEQIPERIDLPTLPLRPGDRFGLAPLETAQRMVAGSLAAKGYAFAQVGVPGELPETGGAYDLILEVRPGPPALFGATEIHMTPPLDPADVRRFLAFEPGQKFSTAALERSVERLYRIPIVDRVDVQPGPAQGGGNLVEVDVLVTTAEEQGLQLEGAISSYACIEGIVGWTSRYFLGAPRVASVSAGASNLFAEPFRNFPCTGVGEDEFAEPDFFVRGDFSQSLGPDTWLHLGGGFSRESSPRAFIQRGMIGRVSLVHEIRRGVELTGAYSPEHRDNPVAGPIFCALFGICGGEDLAQLTSRNTLAPLEIAVAFGPPRARRIDPGTPLMAEWTYPPLPNWTYTGRVAVLGAARPTLSDFDFARLILEGTFTRYPGRLFQVAGKARAGWLFSDGPLPPQVRLFGGGPFSVRGLEPNMLGPRLLTVTRGRVEQLGCEPVPGGCEGISVNPNLVRSRPLGGTSLLEASIEGRMWAARYLQIAIFSDFGLVSIGGQEEVTAAFANAETIYTPGFGVLALTPIGPLRIDLAYDTSPPRVYPLFMRDSEAVDEVLLGLVAYDPYNFDRPTVFEKMRRRLQLQLSMQQPF